MYRLDDEHWKVHLDPSYLFHHCLVGHMDMDMTERVVAYSDRNHCIDMDGVVRAQHQHQRHGWEAWLSSSVNGYGWEWPQRRSIEDAGGNEEHDEVVVAVVAVGLLAMNDDQ